MGNRARLAMGELEAAVMEVMWERGGWLTAGEVQEVLPAERPLAYTTVMTILVRLWQKGRLTRQRDGRAYAYRAVQTKAEFAAARMGEVLIGVGDRSAALNHFLSALEPADRAQLRRLLKTEPQD